MFCWHVDDKQKQNDKQIRIYIINIFQIWKRYCNTNCSKQYHLHLKTKYQKNINSNMDLNTYWIVVRNNHLHFAVNKDFSHISHQKIQQNQQPKHFKMTRISILFLILNTTTHSTINIFKLCDSHSIFDTFDTDSSISFNQFLCRNQRNSLHQLFRRSQNQKSYSC